MPKPALVTTLLFSLIGVPLLLIGPAEERLLGLACLLSFGVSSVTHTRCRVVRNAMNYYFYDPGRHEAIGTEEELARSL